MPVPRRGRGERLGRHLRGGAGSAWGSLRPGMCRAGLRPARLPWRRPFLLVASHVGGRGRRRLPGDKGMGATPRGEDPSPCCGRTLSPARGLRWIPCACHQRAPAPSADSKYVSLMCMWPLRKHTALQTLPGLPTDLPCQGDTCGATAALFHTPAV